MRHDPNALMLFAAGFGTRMGALTADLPKPMLQVAGKPLIDHTLDLAEACDFSTILANLHYRPERLKAHLSKRSVETVLEEPEVLETGGGLKHALPMLGSDCVVTSNTDAVWKGPNPFQCALDAWNPDSMDALLVCVPLKQCLGHTGAGDFILAEDGQLTRSPGDVVYGGIQILKTDLVQKHHETVFSLNVIWNQMLENKRLFGVRYEGNWCDVGRPEGIDLAESMVRGDDV